MHDNGTILSLSDYFPFGLAMEERTFRSREYRYGFNGKENDTDLSSSQLIQDYGFRVYNPVIGKFLSVDPLTKSYPWNSTYAFTENSPIANIDLDGLERIHYSVNNDNGKPVFQLLGKQNARTISAPGLLGWLGLTIDFPLGKEIVVWDNTNKGYRFKTIADAVKAAQNDFGGVEFENTVAAQNMAYNSYETSSEFLGNIGQGLAGLNISRSHGNIHKPNIKAVSNKPQHNSSGAIDFNINNECKY